MDVHDKARFPLALQLLDDSSLGKDYGQFEAMLRNIESALADVVEDSYQGFNTSIGTYGGVIDSISDSQSRVKELRMDLKNSKESLRLRHADLVQLYNKSQQYKDMIEMLDEIDELKNMPSKLEVLTREKHFLNAVTVLVKAHKILQKPEMQAVGALSDLQRYFTEKTEALTETLIEEMHNHLYLKSPYCDSRWSAYVAGQESLSSPDRGTSGLNNDPTKLGKYSNERLKKTPGMRSKLGNEVRLDDEVITEDLEMNPELDSEYYLEILVESLGLLGRFKDAMTAILERVSLETYQLIDKTIAQVNERRNVEALRTLNQRDAALDDEDDERYQAMKNIENEILRDLFWTLFSKLYCVVRGHHAVLTAGQRMLRRIENDHLKQRDLNLAGVRMYSFNDVWLPMLTEIRLLLSDYLTDANQTDDGFGSFLENGSDILRSRRSTRDKHRQLFKFTESMGSLSLFKHYEAQIGSSVEEPLRKALLPENESSQTSLNHSSAAYSGIVQDKYAQLLNLNRGVPLTAAGQAAATGSASATTSTGVSRRTQAATASSVPLIPAYLRAAQNGLVGTSTSGSVKNAISSQTQTASSSAAAVQYNSVVSRFPTSVSGHACLVPPDNAHINVLIAPADSFVEKVRDSIPQCREEGTVVVGAFFKHGVIRVI
ncbi:hypothetical protein DFQ27_007510 [Actinomortierella ambigua]|uniref:Exocyst complex component Sec8 n=1 Tax=Actinomortierella ambigua TaxID=1343610 RepID=A0A9P6PSQ6_9FUNG|nr:hypothetical protein DFQ27_007510 [Actinomortierella ambigua]